MPRPRYKVPNYCRHKHSGQAVVRAIAVAPDKSFVFAGRSNQIHVYDSATGEKVWPAD